LPGPHLLEVIQGEGAARLAMAFSSLGLNRALGIIVTRDYSRDNPPNGGNGGSKTGQIEDGRDVPAGWAKIRPRASGPITPTFRMILDDLFRMIYSVVNPLGFVSRLPIDS
jgi:hypothetical protein